MSVTIYHNPSCSTSRKVLAMIRANGVEPVVVEYLKNPPSRAELERLLAHGGLKVRDILRKMGTPYDELNLGYAKLSDDALFEALERHPILINRPIVASEKGVKICRPAESVLDLL